MGQCLFRRRMPVPGPKPASPVIPVHPPLRGPPRHRIRLMSSPVTRPARIPTSSCAIGTIRSPITRIPGMPPAEMVPLAETSRIVRPRTVIPRATIALKGKMAPVKIPSTTGTVRPVLTNPEPQEARADLLRPVNPLIAGHPTRVTWRALALRVMGFPVVIVPRPDRATVAEATVG
jgi:hypothetical protein